MAKRVHEVVEALARDRHEAARLLNAKGKAETRKLLARAEHDLTLRLARAGDGTFTAEQLRATLAQVRVVTKQLMVGIEGVVLKEGEEAARLGASATAKQLLDIDRAYRGVGGQPLALDEARMLDEASQGVRSSLLRRIGLSGTRKAGGVVEAEEAHRGKPGVLERYGMETIKKFEQTLQSGLIAKKSMREIRADLVIDSEFLQGAPAYWAERIVRTEMMGAMNKGAWESAREAHAQLGDVVKILSATFDDRTGSDSYAVHGQIRHVDEAFEWWDGLYQHPPNRPNDREVVITHRIAWPIPDSLKWRTDAEVAAAWKRDRRKGAPPPRPKMTTVPLSRFGK